MIPAPYCPCSRRISSTNRSEADGILGFGSSHGWGNRQVTWAGYTDARGSAGTGNIRCIVSRTASLSPFGGFRPII